MKCRKILVVEDDKITAKILSSRLKSEIGIPVETAHTMHDAKGLLLDNPDDFCLAILDLNLPDAPNGEIVDFVLSEGVPSLVLTATYAPDVREEITEKNIIDYIIKKSKKDLDYLIKVVSRLFNNKDIKILVVDDSSVARKAMTSVLKRQMFHVLSANDGLEAWQAIQKHPDIKLVITDYNMPHMNGEELIKKIRTKYSHDQMGIIIVSGYVGTEVMPKFLKQGASDYMMKPFATEELLCRVNMNVENKQMIESLRELAFKDPLTGAYNRRYFFETASIMHANSIRHKDSFTVAMIDIDHFKAINDAYGHEAGDAVLQNLVRKLEGIFKRKTDMVARLGGEEFCVVMADTDHKKAHTLLEKTRSIIDSQKVSYLHRQIPYSISCGVCDCQKKSLDEMLRCADSMLYKVKNSGRNNIMACAH
jgi:diguanylate cyclase (GGDEF)-like protein